MIKIEETVEYKAGWEAAKMNKPFINPYDTSRVVKFGEITSFETDRKNAMWTYGYTDFLMTVE